MNRKKNIQPLTNTITIQHSIENNDIDSLRSFINSKITYVQEIVRKTIVSIKKNIQTEIFSNNDANLSITILNELYEKTVEITRFAQLSLTVADMDQLIDVLQKIVDKLSTIICGFGTSHIDDLLFITFGPDYKNMKIDDPVIQDKYELVRQYIQPIGYKILHWKPDARQKLRSGSITTSLYCFNKITDDIIIVEDALTFECFDLDKMNKSFYNKIHGIRVIIQNEKLKKTLVINGLVDDIQLSCFTNKYITQRKHEIQLLADNHSPVEKDTILRIMDTLTLKDILIYGNEDIHKKMISVFTEVNMVKQNKLDITIKKFVELDIFFQRNMLISLLLYNNDDEIRYICYLLYDLITTCDIENENNKYEKMYVYESLPWKIKQYFKDVVKHTVKYTNDMTKKYDVQKITLEQQIIVMKASDNVKEKAMIKLKEVKCKPDEMGLKAKQFLEGLLKIPFGVYREEPILKRVKELNVVFIRLFSLVHVFFPELDVPKKNKYTNIEIVQYIIKLHDYVHVHVLDMIEKMCDKQLIKQIVIIVQYINSIKKQSNERRITIANQSKLGYIKDIMSYLRNPNITPQIISNVYDKMNVDNQMSLSKTIADISAVNVQVNQIEGVIDEISAILDDSIYSHSHAKNQIMKIIGQWMNGEQTGYCFGFEGSPGIGKTSLAKKGLANCLKNEAGETRPFSFIALGGSCNGSTLEGHGYTYVNSTWGKIVDILMESKCMNPIIYVDELDKVSKTENGKEIIGLFTHIIDQTQNDSFQDKYFTGIDIDLSKALFIFSYNDPDQIDRVLLDRIHRIKFENLTLQDKIVIVNKYILPDLNTRMGFENVVELSDEIIEYIIESYTLEPGVRKLKELLFDLYGEINLNILKCKSTDKCIIPIIITKENIETKYLTKYHKMQYKQIHANPEVGIINGLWANAMGRGGIIPIQTLFYPSSKFLELQLTGLQGDVMKESMNVAKSLAWNLTDNKIKKLLLTQFEETKCQGLHIHCPEGGISKDGPSAGVAITCAIYSLFNKIPIRNDIAITGEICLNGEINAIGGLELKITGGIRAKIKTFLFPKSNSRDFCEWKTKNAGHPQLNEIEFKEVSTIQEVFKYIFE